MTTAALAQHPPAVKVGGRRLSVSAPKAKPAPAPQEPLPAEEPKTDYPRPDPAVVNPNEAPPPLHENDPPKKEKKRNNHPNEHEAKGREKVFDSKKHGKKDVAGGHRISQPAGKTMGL